jgi:hypothetical protein
MAGTDHLEVFVRKDGKYDWRKQSANGQIVSGDEGQGFNTSSDAVDAAHREYPGLPVFFLKPEDDG